MSSSASVRARIRCTRWAAAALCLAGAPGLAAAQSAPYAPPQPYAPPRFVPPLAEPPAQPAQGLIPPPQPGQPPAPPRAPVSLQYWFHDPSEEHTPIVKGYYSILRVSAGPGIHFAQGFSARPSFDFDMTGGMGLNLRHPGYARTDLAFEVSYLFSSEPTFGGHFFGTGVTPYLQIKEVVALGWAPKLVVGETWHGTGVGMRNMLVVMCFWDILQVEAGHQFLFVDGKDQHEVRVVFGANLVQAFFALAGVSP